MPRKTAAAGLVTPPTAAGFNEAAARCRGKRPAPPTSPRSCILASMRPRPDAAENAVEARHHPTQAVIASMRPRPDAAENATATDGLLGPVPASMRPRPDAAENAAFRHFYSDGVTASMRPRPDAAENACAAACCAAACELQ